MLVRSRTPAAGWLKADAIRKGLAEDATGLQVAVDSSLYRVNSINQIGQVIRAGQEPTSGRKRYTLNVTASIDQLS